MKSRSMKFSLIELLVTIAIITILTSVLMPALNQTRQKARAIACVNQVRQISQGIFSYADNCNGYSPVNQKHEGLVYYWPRLLWRQAYTPNSAIFACPAANDRYYKGTAYYTGNFNADGNNWGYVQYGINQYFGIMLKAPVDQMYLLPDDEVTLKLLKMLNLLHRTRKPSTTVLLGDCVRSTGTEGKIYQSAATENKPRGFISLSRSKTTLDNHPGLLAMRHGKNANIGWVDGHVEMAKNAVYNYQRTDVNFKYFDPSM